MEARLVCAGVSALGLTSVERRDRLSNRFAVLGILLWLAGMLSIAACSADPSELRGEPLLGSGEWVTVVDDEQLCSTCIHLERIVTIGDDDGPGYHRESRWAAVDRLGRYWVGGMEEIKIYGPRGEFIRQVGRGGEGPLEFRRVGPLYADAAGQIHVFDGGNQRETVFGEDFEPVVEHQMLFWPYEAVPLRGEGRKLINGALGDATRFGLPLHIVAGDSVVASFGALDKGVRAVDPYRRIAVDNQSGIIYSGYPSTYRIELWSAEGMMLLGLDRPGVWDPPLADEDLGPWSRENPPSGMLVALSIDDSSRLWVFSWLPRDDWLDNVEEITLANGVTTIRPEKSNNSIFRAMVEIIDVNRRVVVARRRFSEELIGGVFRQGLVHGNEFLASGEPKLVVWSISFDP